MVGIKKKKAYSARSSFKLFLVLNRRNDFYVNVFSAQV